MRRPSLQVRVIKWIRAECYWALLTGFLMYLGVFGPLPLYGRVIEPVGVLIASVVVHHQISTRAATPYL
jgi:hypothetical protein